MEKIGRRVEEHRKDGGDTATLMANKTVSKPERTVLNTSISLFSHLSSLFFPPYSFIFSLLHSYYFHLPSTLTFFLTFHPNVPLFLSPTERVREENCKKKKKRGQKVEQEKWGIKTLCSVCSGPLTALLATMNISQVFISLFSCVKRISQR